MVINCGTHLFLYFNRTPVRRCSYQKHLCFYLGKKLSFHQHIKEIITKARKGIGFIKKLNNVLPRKALLTICNSFVRPHLDYGDILYHQPYNKSINSKLENIQYNAAFAITGATKGTSRSKLYKELEVILMNTDLIITLRAVLNLCVLVVWR